MNGAPGGAISEPAWKAKPSWYLLTTEDKMIPPDAQRQMEKRAGAMIVEVKGSHSIYVSQPQAVATLIEKAAKGALLEQHANRWNVRRAISDLEILRRTLVALACRHTSNLTQAKENAMTNQIHLYEPLTSQNAALVLVDHQVGHMTGVHDYRRAN